MTNKKRKHKNRERFYYSYDPGPRLYWWVKVANAVKSVVIDGSLAHAIAGYPGATTACHLANCTHDKANRSKFPHPCLLAHFSATTALIITKCKGGKATRAVRYLHSYSWLVRLNDTKVNNKYIEAHPELFNRSFTLRAYKKQKRRGGVATGLGRPRRRIVNLAGLPDLNKGALRRARYAGLIGEPFAKALEQMQEA